MHCITFSCPKITCTSGQNSVIFIQTKVVQEIEIQNREVGGIFNSLLWSLLAIGKIINEIIIKTNQGYSQQSLYKNIKNEIPKILTD